MDPQKLSQLDPKLRDAYQRVMGTTIPEPRAAPDPTSVPQPQPEPEPTSAFTSEPQSAPLAPQQEAIPMPQPAIPTQQASNFVQMNSEVPTPVAGANFTTPVQAQTMAIKKKSGMKPILIAIVVLVLIAVYTLFWTRIFNFKIPFLP